MRERRQIVELYDRGDAAVLVTLIRVEGSSYRDTGARLLIAANGDYVGSISGGCLEAEVIRKAQWLVRGGATVQRYSTLFDDTADIPYGLGCGGTVYLLLEPGNTPEFEALIRAMRASLTGTAQLVETCLPSAHTPLRRRVTSAEPRTWQPGASTLEAGKDQRSRHIELPGEIFVEQLDPPQRLLICGAGNDVQPMVRIAALLGWTVLVADSRPQWARAERFPEAERVLVSSSLDSSSLDSLAVARRDAVVIMTHSYEQDRAWLASLLPRKPRYLGLLGARHRSALLLSEAAARLDWNLDQVCASVFAPVGLDLGGDGAEAIALATIAEIQACIEGKLAVTRRMTPAAVAEQIAVGGASRYLEAQCAL